MRDRIADLIDSYFGVDSAYYDVDKYELADHLIENGATVSPCKLGDTVWVMFYRWGKYEIESRKILSVQFYHSGAIQYHCKDGCFYQSEIGKTVFLTREDAERAGGV